MISINWNNLTRLCHLKYSIDANLGLGNNASLLPCAMNLPKCSHLQVAVLSCLGTDELSGRELRAALKAAGFKKSGAAFYQLMARLEDSDWVAGRYEEDTLHGEKVRERRYKVTGSGREARALAISFYESVSDPDFGNLLPDRSGA